MTGSHGESSSIVLHRGELQCNFCLTIILLEHFSQFLTDFNIFAISHKKRKRQISEDWAASLIMEMLKLCLENMNFDGFDSEKHLEAQNFTV